MGLININNRSSVQIEMIDWERITDIVCDGELPDKDYEIGLILVDSEEMQKMNRRYRGHNSNTDVLTFGFDYDGTLEKTMPSLLLGDIIIDINQIDKQRGPISRKDELIEAFVHGLLHLVGYEHIRSQDKEVMEKAENRYLNIIRGAFNG